MTISICTIGYYISRTLSGAYVTLKVNAAERVFEITQQGTPLKQLPIKGLVDRPLPYSDFLERMCQQARSEYRLAGRSRV